MASVAAVVREFAESTSIHGLLFIFRQKLSTCNRFVWLMIFLLCLAVCLYQCNLNVNDYREMRVTTSIVYQPTFNTEFPSITLCPVNQYKRSIVGNFSGRGIFLYNVIAPSNMSQKAKALLMAQNTRTCESDHLSEASMLIEKNGYPYYLSSGDRMKEYMELLMPAFPNFETDVEKCWLDSKSIKCEYIFINRPIDDGFCFTFNMGKEFRKALGNVSEIDVANSNSTHPKSVRFLLKTNQSDNCEAPLIKRGVGYLAVMTDRDTTPIMMYDPPIFLTPGYINEVMIKPIHYIRNTESLGRCSSVNNVFLTNSTKYMQSLCYFQCIVRAILQTCKCYPPNFVRFHDAIARNVDKLNISAKSVIICNGNLVICAREVQEHFDRTSFKLLCPECVAQCDEYRYNFQVTHLTMLATQLKQNLPHDIIEKLDDKQLKKNYIDVLFKFENNYVEIIQEDQSVTLIDLFINMGNNIGLFLGMSFMSNFEVLICVLMELMAIFLKAAVNKMFPGPKRATKTSKMVRVTTRRNSSVQPIMQCELVQFKNNADLPFNVIRIHSITGL